MVLRIKISNFRGFSGESREFMVGYPSLPDRGCVTSIVGDSASGKSTIVSALELMQAVARGVRTTEELHSGDLAAISAVVDKPSDISVSFSDRGVLYEYGFRFECSQMNRLWKIENEWLSVGDEQDKMSPVFARAGTLVKIGGLEGSDGTYELDQKVFVLSTFASNDRSHPLLRARTYFANLFIFGDKIGYLNDSIPTQRRPCYCWSRAENLGAWLSFQMGANPNFYRILADGLRRYLVGFNRLVVSREPVTGDHLAVMFASSNPGSISRIVPLWMLSSRERMVFIGVILLTVGKVYAPTCVVSDDFDLIEESCPSLAAEIGRVYAGAGQLVALHKHNHKLYQRVLVNLNKEAHDVSH